jgi:hypothetical protein
MSSEIYEVESVYREENGRFAHLSPADFLNLWSCSPPEEDGKYYWEISKYYFFILENMKWNSGFKVLNYGLDLNNGCTILGIPVIWEDKEFNRICLVNDEDNVMVFLISGTDRYEEYIPWYKKFLFWRSK